MIHRDSQYKEIFDFLIMLAAFYSILVNCYQAVLGQQIVHSNSQFVAEIIVETLFFIHITTSFFTQPPLELRNGELDTVNQIAVNYVKTNFLFDLLAWMPYELFAYYFDYNIIDSRYRLFRLRKLLRLKKAINLTSLKFTKVIQAFGSFLPFSLCSTDFKKEQVGLYKLISH